MATRRSRHWSGPRDPDAPPAPPPLVVAVPDSHCHLDLIEDDPSAVVEAAAAVGITPIVTVGIDVDTSTWCADFAAGHDGVHATVAIHPNEAPRAGSAEWEAIARLAARPEVRAVGETGLDHYRTDADGWAAQEESFRRHIAIAKDTGKALVIHDRDAHDDVLRVLVEEGAPDHVVFHCFSGDGDFARRCADAGYVMSFAGNVTFKNAEDLRDAARVAPLDLVLVETDAPFLTPMPYRGKANAPYLVPLTVRALAEVKRVEADELCVAAARTAALVFGY